MKYYSQYKQDQFIFEMFFQKNFNIRNPKGWSTFSDITKGNPEFSLINLIKYDGYFVDIGAHDGVSFSNSKFFEELGWKGVCIEPNPQTFNELENNRNSSTQCIMKAISNKKSTENFTSIQNVDNKNKDGINMLSGLTDKFDIKAKENINKLKNDPNYKVSEIKLETDLFSNLNPHKEIDYLSVDTEGNELEILKSINFDEYNIKTMTIENNTYNSNLILDYLTSKNYTYVARLRCDEMYVCNNYLNEISHNNHHLLKNKIEKWNIYNPNIIFENNL